MVFASSLSPAYHMCASFARISSRQSSALLLRYPTNLCSTNLCSLTMVLLCVICHLYQGYGATETTACTTNGLSTSEVEGEDEVDSHSGSKPTAVLDVVDDGARSPLDNER